jgi:hypothetical protein
MHLRTMLSKNGLLFAAFIAVLICAQLVGSDRLLLIGDSFDREFVFETCNHYKTIGEIIEAREWGQVYALILRIDY